MEGLNKPKYTKCRNTRVVTAEMLEEIKTLYTKGWSYTLIAEKFGVSKSSVFNYIKGLQKPYEASNGK